MMLMIIFSSVFIDAEFQCSGTGRLESVLEQTIPYIHALIFKISLREQSLSIGRASSRSVGAIQLAVPIDNGRLLCCAPISALMANCQSSFAP